MILPNRDKPNKKEVAADPREVEILRARVKERIELLSSVLEDRDG